jgi:hypothetical protein
VPVILPPVAAITATSKVRTSKSSIAGRKATTIDPPRWLPKWSAVTLRFRIHQGSPAASCPAPSSDEASYRFDDYSERGLV